MDTSDDINVLPTPLPVNESDQSEIAHGTQQAEPTNPPNATSFLLDDYDGRLPKFVNFRILFYL